MPRWVRTAVACAFAFAAWVVVTPARAWTMMSSVSIEERAPQSSAATDPTPAPMPTLPTTSPTTRAPLCDDRGATTFAPAPQLQAPQTSIEMDERDDCLSNFLDDGVAHQGGAPRAFSAAPDAAMVTLIPAVARCPRGELVVVHFDSILPPAGERFRVERPPRIAA